MHFPHIFICGAGDERGVTEGGNAFLKIWRAVRNRGSFNVCHYHISGMTSRSKQLGKDGMSAADCFVFWTCSNEIYHVRKTGKANGMQSSACANCRLSRCGCPSVLSSSVSVFGDQLQRLDFAPCGDHGRPVMTGWNVIDSHLRHLHYPRRRSRVEQKASIIRIDERYQRASLVWVARAIAKLLQKIGPRILSPTESKQVGDVADALLEPRCIDCMSTQHPSSRRLLPQPPCILDRKL